jgi:two-component system, NarL family, sensor histidine kinase UhpB
MRFADLSHPHAAAFILSLTVAVLTTDLCLDLAGVAPWVEYTSLAALTSVLIAGAYARWVAVRRLAEAHKLDLLTLLRDTQEEEQLRIARKLHDQMSQDLIGLSLMLKTLEPAVQTDEARETLRQLATLTGDMDRRAHGIAWELRPSLPSAGGLHLTLENYVSDWSERFRIAVDFRCLGLDGDDLPALVEATIFRVVREAFTNIRKHAAARNVRLAVEHEADRLRVVIEDHGKGLDHDAAMAPGRCGLMGIRERLALIDGTLSIEAASPSGTILTITAPLARVARSSS